MEDVAETVATNLANATAFGRAYNLAQREALSLRQFVILAAEALGLTPAIVPVPREWLESIGLGTVFSPYTHSHDILLDCRAAQEELLFRPTPARRWIRQLVAAFRRSWNGTLTAFAATRTAELELARELGTIRLSSYRLAETGG